MKLLYITNAINGSGGLERVLAVKASYLAEKFGYQVHVLTLNNGDSNPFYEFSSLITYHDIKVGGSNPLSHFLNYRNGIQKVLKKVNPNVISVCDDGLKGMLFPVVFGKNIPVIYERHASVNLNFKKHSKATYFERIKNKIVYNGMLFGAKKFNSFVILTNGNTHDWPKVNCTVIPNSIPFKVNLETVHNPKKTILAVGSQSYNKGYDRLIDSWSIVNKKYPDWVLKVYGKQDEFLKLQSKIDKAGITTSMLLFDPVKNIESVYKEASIFVLPSRSEGFGMVLIEAMAFGVPCIAFDCPHGPADIITHEEDGLLIENGDIKGFASAIIKLIENEEERKRMGAVAKRNVTRYAPGNIAPIWDQLFKNLIK